MHPEILRKKTGEDLEILGKSRILDQFYLAGGTGLALFYGHRTSLDLDFFSSEKFNAIDIVKALKKEGVMSVNTLESDAVHGTFGDTKLSLLYYPYTILRESSTYGGVQIADPIDIACMKISAISSRGTKKDFVDLFYLLEHHTLREMLGFFEEKYEEIGYNIMHILKSLTYFNDADMDPDPEYIKETSPSWTSVKRRIQLEVKKLV